jgi:hypothetical protein
MNEIRKQYLEDLLQFSEKIKTIQECIYILQKSGLDEKHIKELWKYEFKMLDIYELKFKEFVAKEESFSKIS